MDQIYVKKKIELVEKVSSKHILSFAEHKALENLGLPNLSSRQILQALLMSSKVR